MIHKVILMDQYSGLGFDLYDDKTVKVDPSLLTGLIGALLLFTGNLSHDFVLKKIDIGTLTITVTTMHGLQYVCFSDYFDNNEYIQEKLSEIIALVSPLVNPNDFLDVNIPDSLSHKINGIVESIDFPRNIIPESYKDLDQILTDDNIIFETLLIVDLNHGLVHSYSGDEKSANLLIELMSQLPFSNNWTGESEKYIRNGVVVKECLLLSRIGDTNFFLLAKSIYKPSLYGKMLDQFNLFRESLAARISRS